MVKPFLSENACSFNFSQNKKTVDKMMKSAYLCVILYVEHKKNTISWGFNLIFNTLGTGHYLSPGGGGLGSEDFGLNTMKVSRSPL